MYTKLECLNENEKKTTKTRLSESHRVCVAKMEEEHRE